MVHFLTRKSSTHLKGEVKFYSHFQLELKTGCPKTSSPVSRTVANMFVSDPWLILGNTDGGKPYIWWNNFEINWNNFEINWNKFEFGALNLLEWSQIIRVCCMLVTHPSDSVKLHQWSVWHAGIDNLIDEINFKLFHFISCWFDGLDLKLSCGM